MHVVHQVGQQQVEGEEGGGQEEVVHRVQALPVSTPRITITVRKNSSETGAKKVMRAARGPGLRRFGRSMPTFWPVTRLSKRQPSRQPSPFRLRRRRDGAGGEVEAREVRAHRQDEVLHVLTPGAETVRPVVEPARAGTAISTSASPCGGRRWRR